MAGFVNYTFIVEMRVVLYQVLNSHSELKKLAGVFSRYYLAI
jgi:hypothetical protein